MAEARFGPNATIRSEVGVKASHIGEVGNQQSEDQGFFDHHALLKNRARIDGRRLNGNRERVPKFVFYGIQIPFTRRSPRGPIPEVASHSTVMPGLVPGIHAFLGSKQGVDGRDKPGHDDC